MSSASPATSLLFYPARVVVGKEVPERSKLARLLSENGAFCISGSSPIADLKFPPPAPVGDLYFLLDSFTGETYEDLKRKGAKIIGPQVVYDSLRLQKPLPQATHPVFCRTLDGMHITCTGFQARKKAEIEVLVQYMNGSYCKDLTTSIDCLIAAEVGSEKYQVATQRQIPVVCYDWIVQAWKSQTQPPAKNFALPPLSGLVICVTGRKPDTRLHIRKLVTTNGGRYSADLTRHCTHLLAETPAGDKFRYAAVWHIPTVTTDWLFDCVNQQAYQDVSRYLVCPNLSAPNFASTSNADASYLVPRDGNSNHSIVASASELPVSLSSDPLPNAYRHTIATDSNNQFFRTAPPTSVPLSPSPSESLIHAGSRRRLAPHNLQRRLLQQSTNLSSPISTQTSNAVSEYDLSSSSSSSSTPAASSSAIIAQLNALNRTVSVLCRHLQQQPAAEVQESLSRDLTAVHAMIERISASLFTPHTAPALLLSAESGDYPAFRSAVVRYITEHFDEVRTSPSYHALPARLQYEMEAAALLHEHANVSGVVAGAAAAAAVAAHPTVAGAASPAAHSHVAVVGGSVGGGVVSASSSSLPDLVSPASGPSGSSEPSAGSKRRRIS